MIWGPPGIGKSQIVHQTAKKHNFHVNDIRLSQKAPEDIHGLPFINGERTQWTKSDIFPDDGRKTLLFFDEITHADGRLRKAAFQIILDRQIGKHKLPDDCVIIAAGNRVEDNSGAQPMELALLTRFVHFELEPDINDFAVFWVKTKKDPRILAYLRSKPSNLFNLPDSILSGNAHPCPRTWEFVDRILKLLPKPNKAIAGAVGPGVAREFAKFLKLDMPDIDYVLENPDSYKPDNEPISIQYTMCGALASAVSMKTMDNFVKIMENHTQEEFAVYMSKDLFLYHPELIINPKFQIWAAKHKHLIF